VRTGVELGLEEILGLAGGGDTVAPGERGQLGASGGGPGDGGELLLQVAPALVLPIGSLALGGRLVAAGAGHDRLLSSHTDVAKRV
jgi:hypothetical protein